MFGLELSSVRPENINKGNVMISLSQEIFPIISSPGAHTGPLVVVGVRQTDPVQEVPPAHQVFRTAHTIKPGGLQLAEGEGEGVGGAEGEAWSLY